MAKLKKEDLKELTREELVERIGEEQLRLQKMRFNHAVSPLENPLSIKSLRRDIARLKTELREKEAAESKQNDTK